MSLALDTTPQADWDALVTRHQRRVLVSLVSEGLGVQDAREVAQEAWARVWQQSRSGALATLTFPGIVVMQARFLARDLQRRRRTAPVEAEATAPDVATSQPTAEASLASAQVLARVRTALELQSDMRRRVFQLACGEDLPHAEVAQRVGLSVQRVRQIIWEVRTSLRATLEEEA